MLEVVSTRKDGYAMNRNGLSAAVKLHSNDSSNWLSTARSFEGPCSCTCQIMRKHQKSKPPQFEYHWPPAIWWAPVYSLTIKHGFASKSSISGWWDHIQIPFMEDFPSFSLITRGACRARVTKISPGLGQNALDLWPDAGILRRWGRPNRWWRSPYGEDPAGHLWLTKFHYGYIWWNIYNYMYIYICITCRCIICIYVSLHNWNCSHLCWIGHFQFTSFPSLSASSAKAWQMLAMRICSWQTYKKLLEMATDSGFSHWTWWFSVVISHSLPEGIWEGKNSTWPVESWVRWGRTVQPTKKGIATKSNRPLAQSRKKIINHH